MLGDLGIMLVVLGAVVVCGAGWLFATAWLPFKLMDWWEERTRLRALSETEGSPDGDSS